MNYTQLRSNENMCRDPYSINWNEFLGCFCKFWFYLYNYNWIIHVWQINWCPSEKLWWNWCVFVLSMNPKNWVFLLINMNCTLNNILFNCLFYTNYCNSFCMIMWTVWGILLLVLWKIFFYDLFVFCILFSCNKFKCLLTSFGLGFMFFS